MFLTRTKNRENYNSVYLSRYILGQQTGRQKIPHRMTASIPWLQSALNFSWIEFWFFKVVPRHLNCSTLSNELLSCFMWHRPAFWFRDMTMYLVLSAFTSRPASLPASAEVSVFFIVCTLPSDVLRHHQHKPKLMCTI